MISTDWSPGDELKEFISQYRLRHFIFQPGVIPSCKPFPPRPEQCLCFYVRGKETVEYLAGQGTKVKPKSVISGQFTSRVNRYVSVPEFLMISVDFRPGALYRLTGIPFHEFANLDIDAEIILGRGLREVNDRLSGMDDYVKMINEIEQYCLSLVRSKATEQIALDLVLRDLHQDIPLNVDDLSKRSFLSCRQLERKFNERVGISPRSFIKLSRFHKSYKMRLSYQNLNWFSIAVHSGFSDYQHMAKVYKEYALAGPNQYLDEEKSAPGRILGLTSPIII